MRRAAEAKKIELVKSRATPIRSAKMPLAVAVAWSWVAERGVGYAAGEIDVSLREVNEQAEIHVTDAGIGIHADLVPHVFERFRQAEDATTRGARWSTLRRAIGHHLVDPGKTGTR